MNEINSNQAELKNFCYLAQVSLDLAHSDNCCLNLHISQAYKNGSSYICIFLCTPISTFYSSCLCIHQGRTRYRNEQYFITVIFTQNK